MDVYFVPGWFFPYCLPLWSMVTKLRPAQFKATHFSTCSGPKTPTAECKQNAWGQEIQQVKLFELLNFG